MNSIDLIGRLTADPALRQTGGGTAVADFRIAVPRPGRDRAPVYIDVTVYGGLASVVHEHLDKGRRVAVSGRLELEEWQAKDGGRRSKHSVVADTVDFLDRATTDGEEN